MTTNVVQSRQLTAFCEVPNRLLRVSNFIPPSPVGRLLLLPASLSLARGRLENDEKRKTAAEKRDVRLARERSESQGREAAKSVNFLTFYEPSEFHNLEPVRVVLCTRKVSRAKRPLSPARRRLSLAPRRCLSLYFHATLSLVAFFPCYENLEFYFTQISISHELTIKWFVKIHWFAMIG